MSLSFKPNSAGNGATIEYNGTPAIMLNPNGGGFRDSLSSGMTNYLYPSSDGSYRDIARSGWLHAGLNQQWGGGQWGAELVDGATGNLYKFDVATGQIEDNVGGSFGVSSNWAISQRFVVSESMTLDTVWLKLYKVGNPTDNVIVRIYSDVAGTPTTPLGTSVATTMKKLSSKTDGEFIKFSGLNCSLSANTVYHVYVSRDGGTNDTNYPVIRVTTTYKYPFGGVIRYYNGSTWVSGTSIPVFLIENPSSTRLLQSGGQFDQKLVFGADTYPSQIKALWQPLKNFFDSKEFTFPFRGTGTKGKPLADFLYGLDHDRVLLSCNTSTGYAQVDVWDSAGTKRTVTGTTDVSTGFHDVAVHVRAKGDGLDKIELFVDGVSQGTPLTGLTLTFDPLMRDLGNGFVGAGMPTAPTWTQKLDMSSLPSANGWTWTGTGVEANCMSVSGGKLYQNKNGYGATDYGYYQKSTALNNVTGWCVEWKVRVPSNTNQATGTTSGVYVGAFDGTKFCYLYIQEYFLQIFGSGALDFVVQGDFKSQEHTFGLYGKGSDYYLFIDGKLAVDGTGKLTNATATNAVLFGDQSNTSGENADAIWDYVAYYTGGMLTLQAGGECHEIAFWSGDKTSYLPAIYNSGSPISIKQFTGQSRNYVGEGVVQKEVRRGVTSSPTTTSTTPVLLTDMECYVVGSDFIMSQYSIISGTTVGNGYYTNCSVDGIAISTDIYQVPVANYQQSIGGNYKHKGAVGLHKLEVKMGSGAGTATSMTTSRNLTVEARS